MLITVIPFTFRLMSNKCLITHISFESAATLKLFSFSRLCSGWQFNPTASVSFKPFSECQSLCFKKTLTSSNETCQDDFDLDKILFVLNSYESNCHVQWSPTSCYLISVSRWYLLLDLSHRQADNLLSATAAHQNLMTMPLSCWTPFYWFFDCKVNRWFFFWSVALVITLALISFAHQPPDNKSFKHAFEKHFFHLKKN